MSETTQTVLFRFQITDGSGRSPTGNFIKSVCLQSLSAAGKIKILLKFVRAGDSSAMWISRPYHYKFYSFCAAAATRKSCPYRIGFLTADLYSLKSGFCKRPVLFTLQT